MMETIFVVIMVAVVIAWVAMEFHAVRSQRGAVAKQLGIPQVTRAAEINLRKRPNRRFAVAYKVPRDAIHRRAQRAESETAKARREAIGQRKRADWWKSEAKRLGWEPHYEEVEATKVAFGDGVLWLPSGQPLRLSEVARVEERDHGWVEVTDVRGARTSFTGTDAVAIVQRCTDVAEAAPIDFERLARAAFDSFLLSLGIQVEYRFEGSSAVGPWHELDERVRGAWVEAMREGASYAGRRIARDVAERNLELARQLEAATIALDVLRGGRRGSREDLRTHILCYPGPTRLHDVAFVTSPGTVAVYVYPNGTMSEAERDEFHAYVRDGVPVPLLFTIHHREASA